jgi:hypothetical protein
MIHDNCCDVKNNDSSQYKRSLHYVIAWNVFAIVVSEFLLILPKIFSGSIATIFSNLPSNLASLPLYLLYSGAILMTVLFFIVLALVSLGFNYFIGLLMAWIIQKMGYQMPNKLVWYGIIITSITTWHVWGIAMHALHHYGDIQSFLANTSIEIASWICWILFTYWLMKRFVSFPWYIIFAIIFLLGGILCGSDKLWTRTYYSFTGFRETEVLYIIKEN